MRIFLSGPMGAGKSTVAAALATRLSRRLVDLDADIVADAGKPIAEIFRDEGEPAFRARERDALRRLFEGPDDVVVALGGGTLTDRALRREALSRGIVVTLTAPAAELGRRVGGDAARPLVAGRDATAVLAALLAARAEAYAECHGRIDTSASTVAETVDEIVALEARRPIAVPLGPRSYTVHFGSGILRDAGRLAREAVRGRLALAVIDRGARPFAAQLVASLAGAGFDVREAAVAGGEAEKTLATVERLWDAALDAGIDRESIVVALGGGVVGDLAGFAASTVLRGVAFAQVPSTLLAMVDSSVGGKTGFDRPQGKNLVGTFHQPRFVVCDVALLSTLPVEERRAGLAEVVKSAWLAGEDAVAALERDAEALAAGEPEAVERAIRMAVGLKAAIVTEDERESGARRLLNLGHTVGHAIEAASGFRVRHGEAVAMGMVAAFRVAERLGRSPAHRARVTELLRSLDLPTEPTSPLSEHTLRYMGTDKKRAGRDVHFVVPDAPGRTEVVKLSLETLRDWLG